MRCCAAEACINRCILMALRRSGRCPRLSLRCRYAGRFCGDNIDGINWLSDRLRVVVILNGVEYPCGVFIITTAPKRKVGGLKLIDIEGYSPLYLAQRKKLETRLHIDAGANYVTQINNLLIASGISDITSTATSLTLATAREDWEIGTPYLTIINQLLAEINYNSVWVNLNGTARGHSIYRAVAVGYHANLQSGYGESDR